MKVIHFIGSSMFVTLLSFVIVDLLNRRKLTGSELIGRVLIALLLIMALLRT